MASALICSREDHVDENAEQAWAEEIVRRVAEIDSGNVELVSWTEARRRYEAGDLQAL